MHDIPEFSIAEYCVLVQAEPNYYEEAEHHSPHVMVWETIIGVRSGGSGGALVPPGCKNFGQLLIFRAI